ncbi:MAG: IclR family transcriptional regulator [Beutenbergiaceae bacterium]
MSMTTQKLVGADRVLAVLTLLADYPAGTTLDELVRVSSHPKATVHRALASLERAGLCRKVGRGRYILGDEFLRLAFAHHEARPEHVRVQPVLRGLVERFGETAHFAVLDADEVVYRAKLDPPAGAVRLTSTVGGRNPAHCTAVGKLLLSSHLTDRHDVTHWLAGRELTQRTANTITTIAALTQELARVRERGYGVDDQENEPGINCIAFPVFLGSPTQPSGAVSVSALAYRTPLSTLTAAAEEIRTLVRNPPIEKETE